MKRKSQVTTTEPKSPNFTKVKSKALERTYVNEGEPGTKLQESQDRFKATLAKQRSRKSTTATEPTVQVSSTRAMELANKAKREQIEA